MKEMSSLSFSDTSDCSGVTLFLFSWAVGTKATLLLDVSHTPSFVEGQEDSAVEESHPATFLQWNLMMQMNQKTFYCVTAHVYVNKHQDKLTELQYLFISVSASTT